MPETRQIRRFAQCASRDFKHEDPGLTGIRTVQGAVDALEGAAGYSGATRHYGFAHRQKNWREIALALEVPFSTVMDSYRVEIAREGSSLARNQPEIKA